MRLIDADMLELDTEWSEYMDGFTSYSQLQIDNAPTIEAIPVRHGWWIECDYKHMEHGMIGTEPKAGLRCSECCAAFQKKKMTYKKYCAACGSIMDADEIAMQRAAMDDYAEF